MVDHIVPLDPATVSSSDGFTAIVGDATSELGEGCDDEESVLSRIDDIGRETFRDSILDKAKHALEKCGDPSRTPLKYTHLVIGHVQSGKTISMMTLMCLAKDNGFKIVIVLAGTTTNLVAQTSKRMREYLGDIGDGYEVEFDDSKAEVKSDLSKSFSDISYNLKSVCQEANKHKDSKTMMVLVVMKHHDHLRHLVDVFKREKENLPDCPILIIDDEADQVSLNAANRSKTTSQSANNRQIVELRNTLDRFIYVQYTATPQANLLTHVADELSPDSVTILEPGAAYVGGREFFPKGKPLPAQIHKIDPIEEDDQDVPPDSLKLALYVFLLSIAQLSIQAAGNKKKKQKRYSMMVHPARLQDSHDIWHKWVESLWNGAKKVFNWEKSDPALSSIQSTFQPAHDELQKTCKHLKPLPELLNVLEKVKKFFKICTKAIYFHAPHYSI